MLAHWVIEKRGTRREVMDSVEDLELATEWLYVAFSIATPELRRKTNLLLLNVH